MEKLNFAALLLHILCGYLALGSGAIVMLTRKGDKKHRLWGRLFFFSMLGVTASALFLSVFKNIPFLLYIGLFVFYQNYAGYRSIRDRSLKPTFPDVLVLLIAFVNGLFMLKSGSPVLMVFGSISMLLVFTDFRIYLTLYRNRALPPRAWLARHIGMMMGAYIGTITAFLTVNIKNFEPAWVIWLAPTAILVPLLLYWTRKYAGSSVIKLGQAV